MATRKQILAGSTGQIADVTWLDDTNIVYATNWSAFAGPTPVGYRSIQNILFLRGKVGKAAGNFNSNELVMTLPLGYRPSATRRCMVAPESTLGSYVFIEIHTNGQVNVWEGGVASGNPSSYSSFWLDNVCISL